MFLHILKGLFHVTNHASSESNLPELSQIGDETDGSVTDVGLTIVQNNGISESDDDVCQGRSQRVPLADPDLGNIAKQKSLKKMCSKKH